MFKWLASSIGRESLSEITIGSTQSAITITTLNEQKIIIPTLTILEKYSTKSRLINQNRFFKIQENLKLEEFKEIDKIPENIVHGCTSQLWLTHEIKDGKMFFYGTSDAIIVKGLVFMILKIFSNSTIQELKDIDYLEIADKIKRFSNQIDYSKKLEEMITTNYDSIDKNSYNLAINLYKMITRRQRNIRRERYFELDFIYSKLTLRPRPLNSCNNTFRDSGIPGVGIGSPLTIAS